MGLEMFRKMQNNVLQTKKILILVSILMWTFLIKKKKNLKNTLWMGKNAYKEVNIDMCLAGNLNTISA